MNRTALAAGLLLTLTGLATQAQPLTMAVKQDIRSTHPGVNRDGPTDGVVLHMVEGLVGYRENGSVGPLLAERIEMSEDGQRYTFPLRKDVTFHNGQPLTADDVVWSWQSYLDPDTKWRCLPEFDGRNGLKIESVQATDAHTVVFQLSRASATFLDMLARTDCGMAGILHRDSFKADGSWDKPVGTGPFRLDAWVRGQYVDMKRYEGYVSPPGDERDGYLGLKQAHVDHIRFLVVPDLATMKAGLGAGNLDIADIPLSDISEFKTNPRLRALPGATAAKFAMLFQTRDPALSNVKLRQAIAAAIDYEQLVAAMTEGEGQPNNSAIYPHSEFYSDIQRKGYTYDPERARALLRESGYRGEPIKLVANKQTQVFPPAVMVQAMLQAVGINVTLDVMEWGTQLDRYNTGNYQMMSFSYSPRLDGALSYESFTGDKETQPRKTWDNPRALALLREALTVADPARRQALFDELHTLQLEDVPLIITHNRIDVGATGAHVEGYQPWLTSTPRLWGVRVQR